jgi:hypothetical protein
MRADALRWSSEVAGQRACRPLDGAAPAAVFTAVEAPALRPLPAAPFVLATWSAATVGPDIRAKVGATLYSLPWRFLGERVDARATTSMVQFFRHGELIKTHPHKERGKQTDFGDYPPEKIAFHMRTPTWCRTKATEIGPACEVVISELLADNALFRLRATQRVLGLGDRHDPGRLEAACAKATTADDPILPHDQRHPRRRHRGHRPGRPPDRGRRRPSTPARTRPALRRGHLPCPPPPPPPRHLSDHGPRPGRRNPTDQQTKRLMTAEPIARAVTDRSGSDPAPLVPTPTPAARLAAADARTRRHCARP